ncbi:MAG: sulfite exporter TauE/SafE family protein [Chloroflexi bacterium HGW-Chloroflexi-10]|nr:MAG: sulfite exporter TauE/SafE family protein [Chloroflexi bacterium HGW-Chloroflexi-10]
MEFIGNLSSTTIWIALILFFATLVRSVFGFGGGLIAMPLLTLVIGVQTASPIAAALNTFNAFLILLFNWRKVDLSSAWRLVVASILGIPLGILLLTKAYESVVTGILAVVIIIFSVFNLIKPQFKAKISERSAFVFGFFAGILGAAYNANGPLAVIYGTLRKWPADSFRATLQAYFFPVGLIILFGQGASGLITPEVIQYAWVLLPMFFLGQFVGSKINHSIPLAAFEKGVHLFLIATAVVMLVKIF